MPLKGELPHVFLGFAIAAVICMLVVAHFLGDFMDTRKTMIFSEILNSDKTEVKILKREYVLDYDDEKFIINAGIRFWVLENGYLFVFKDEIPERMKFIYGLDYEKLNPKFQNAIILEFTSDKTYLPETEESKLNPKKEFRLAL
ncbi:hypothetical protein ACFL16_02100 [Patescibacteria group bacterium]